MQSLLLSHSLAHVTGMCYSNAPFHFLDEIIDDCDRSSLRLSHDQGKLHHYLAIEASSITT